MQGPRRQATGIADAGPGADEAVGIPADASATKPDGADAALKDHMKDHFAAITEIQRAVVRTTSRPPKQALVDRAVGELARLHARLGHVDKLERLFRDVGSRSLAGPATETMTGAREGAWVMRNESGIAYLADRARSKTCSSRATLARTR